MGLLSASISLARYCVEGELSKPILKTLADALKKNAIMEIDNDIAEKTAGWTSFHTPYIPDFSGSSFSIGTYMVFSMRIDKKSLPSKVVNKHYTMEMAQTLAKSGRSFLTREEKKMIKETVTNKLLRQIPATPNIYDIVWDYEGRRLMFFSNLKSANEAFETLFSQSFHLKLYRLFPYTTAELSAGLSGAELDRLSQLTPTRFNV